MKIRKATKKDSLQILNIMKLNSPNYSKTLALKEINEMFSKSLIKPTYLVAEEKGECAGDGRELSENSIWAEAGNGGDCQGLV